MNIRLATSEDKQHILEVISVLHLDMPGFVWNQEDFVIRQIHDKEYFLAEEHGMVLGIISLRHGKNKIHMETLAVAEKFRRQGVGAKLVEFAKQVARERNFAILHAYSFQEYGAGTFYAKQGFRQLSETGAYNNHAYDCFEVEL